MRIMIRSTCLFQSTLPRGERLALQQRKAQPTYFNPRSREGSDEELLNLFMILILNFNPRSREGSDFNFI